MAAWQNPGGNSAWPIERPCGHQIDRALYCTAKGPKETPYEGGTFELVISVPEQYPLTPPSVRYRTKIFHPNVHFKVSCGQTE